MSPHPHFIPYCPQNLGYIVPTLNIHPHNKASHDAKVCVTVLNDSSQVVWYPPSSYGDATAPLSDKICYPKSFKSAAALCGAGVGNRLQFPAAQMEFPEPI